MFFLGSNFLGLEDGSEYTPVIMKEATGLILKGGIYDEMYITRDTNTDMTDKIPNTWDTGTIMYASFNGTTAAGDPNWSDKSINGLVVKRREISDQKPISKWTTIFAKEVKKLSDFKFIKQDFFNRANTTYEYALVPMRGTEEGTYVTETIFSEFNYRIFIMEKESWWGAVLTDGALNTTRNIAKTYHTILHRRYPVPVTSATVNYDSGSCEADWVPFDCETCEFKWDDATRTPYEKKFMDFLTNYNPKILKSFDGRMWLVDVDPSPSNNMGDTYYMRNIGFNWTEIGDYESENDLYQAGLVDIEPKFLSSADAGFI